MARIRSIKSDFFLDTNLSKKPPLARLLFAGLWVYADKKGVLEEDQELLKVQILPYEKRLDLESLLKALEPDQIIRYAVDGRSYIWIRNFLKHQKPHPKEAESNLPVPPKEAQSREIKFNSTKGYECVPSSLPSSVPVGVVVGYGSGNGSLSLGVGTGKPDSSQIFKKPTPAEVSTYAKEIGFDLDGETFVNFYESKDWMIGKNRMKDWKAAVRTWKSKRGGQSGKAENRVAATTGKYAGVGQ